MFDAFVSLPMWLAQQPNLSAPIAETRSTSANLSELKPQVPSPFQEESGDTVVIWGQKPAWLQAEFSDQPEVDRLVAPSGNVSDTLPPLKSDSDSETSVTARVGTGATPASAPILMPIVGLPQPNPSSDLLGDASLSPCCQHSITQGPITQGPMIIGPLAGVQTSVVANNQGLVPTAESTALGTTTERQHDETNRLAQASSSQPLEEVGIFDLTADRQELDQLRQIAIAEGNVRVIFKNGELLADRLHVNLQTEVMRAEGNVRFVRGAQRFQGSFFEYNTRQGTGEMLDVIGEIALDRSQTDLDLNTPTIDLENNLQVLDRPIRTASQVVPGLIVSTGFNTRFITGQGDDDATDTDDDSVNPETIVQGIPVDVDSFRQEGTVKHWRFRATKVTLFPDGWDAESLRLTNDPFSNEDIELRTASARYRELDPFRAELITEQPRVVLENWLPIPTFRRRYILDSRSRDAGFVTLAFDNGDRGGWFLERTFEPISTDTLRINLTPQFFVQRAVSGSDSSDDEDLNFADNFGLIGRIEAQPWPGGTITGSARLLSFNPERIGDDARASLRATQSYAGYDFSLEASYRDRLFNGSLGFQTVQNSFGLVVQSPNYRLGPTGIRANYQLGVQQINANTDQSDLLEPDRDNDRVTLTRYQATAGLSRFFSLWRAETKPRTATWLRYSPTVTTPNLYLSLGLRGTYSGYSDGSSQPVLTGTASLGTTLGRFRRNWLDYTNLVIAYRQALINEDRTSPFTFDRVADQRTLSFRILQQIYGPFRFGFATNINLDTQERISTAYTLRYSQRAYDLAIQFNPVQELGTVTFQLHDFLWSR